MSNVMDNLTKEIEENVGINSGDIFTVNHNSIYSNRKETIQYQIIDVIKDNLEDSFSVLVDMTNAVLTEYTGDNQEVAFGMFLEENRFNIERLDYGQFVYTQNITREFVEEEKLKEQLKEQVRLTISYAEIGDVICLETYRGTSRYLILEKLTSNGTFYSTKGYTVVNLVEKCTTFIFGDTIEELIESLVEKEGKVLSIGIESLYSFARGQE